MKPPVLTIALLCAAASGLELHVAPDGDDRAAGTAAAPLATLSGARDAVRKLRAEQGARISEPVTVRLHAGIYPVAEPVVFGPGDGGTAAAPVRYEAAGDGPAVISGGREIDGWTRAADGSWAVALPEVAAGTWYFRQLFVAREGEDPQRRYRPDRGALVIGGLTNAPTRPGGAMAHRASQDEFIYRPGTFDGIEDTSDVEVVALHDWSSSRLRIRELDRDARVVKFTAFPTYRIGHWWAGGKNPYYLENVAAEFGQPGRFHLDRRSGLLRYQPLPGEEPANLRVWAPVATQLVKLQGEAALGLTVDHLAFIGLKFWFTAWSLGPEGYTAGQGMTDLPAAVALQGTTHCRIERCDLAHLGAYAVSLGDGCHDNLLLGNRLYDLGGGGVLVGSRDSKALPPKLATGNRIANNLISDGGLVHFSAHGVWNGISADTTIEHNVVRRFLYSNISSGWVWSDAPSSARNTVIAHNDIHDAMLLLADGGAIYSLGWQPGSVIRDNHIHGVRRSVFAGRAHNNGIFFDQGSKAWRVENNVIEDVFNAPIRYNQCQEDWMSWGENVILSEPSDPRRQAILAQAGLQPEYRDLLALPLTVTPTPMLQMELPTVAPLPVAEDFEAVAPGKPSAAGNTQGEDLDKGALIRVTDQVAAQGRHSLEFRKVPGLAKPFYPYLLYAPHFGSGHCRVRFQIRLGPGAAVNVEGRTTIGAGFAAGPSLTFGADQTVRAGDQVIGKLAAETWAEVQLELPLGQEAGTYDIAIQPAGGQRIEAAGLPCRAEQFRALDWFGFVMQGDREQTIWLDDVRIELVEAK